MSRHDLHDKYRAISADSEELRGLWNTQWGLEVNVGFALAFLLFSFCFAFVLLLFAFVLLLFAFVLLLFAFGLLCLCILPCCTCYQSRTARFEIDLRSF
jgi:Flp pilus assembly protein TadB